MSWFSQWSHPGRAYKKAGQVEAENFNKSQQFRNPAIEHGEEAYKTYNDMYNKLAHPEDLQSDWASHYEKSPYAQNLQQEALGQGMDAASASGLGGSSAAIANIQKGGADIMQKDRQQYMDDMMKKYLAAMGIGSDIYGKGTSMASNAANAQQQHGEWNAQNQFNQNNAGGNKFGDIASSIPAMIAAMYGGGMGGGKSSQWHNPGSINDSMYGGGR